MVGLDGFFLLVEMVAEVLGASPVGTRHVINLQYVTHSRCGGDGLGPSNVEREKEVPGLEEHPEPNRSR